MLAEAITDTAGWANLGATTAFITLCIWLVTKYLPSKDEKQSAELATSRKEFAEILKAEAAECRAERLESRALYANERKLDREHQANLASAINSLTDKLQSK